MLYIHMLHTSILAALLALIIIRTIRLPPRPEARLTPE